MQITCRCEHCSQTIAFEKADAGKTGTCPQCGMETRLYVRAPEPVSTPSAQDRAMLHLKFIRQNSCYSTLRAVIEICCGLLIALAVIGTVLQVVGGMSNPEIGSKFALISGAIGVIVVILIIALRQGALLMIDLADSTIREHSKTHLSEK